MLAETCDNSSMGKIQSRRLFLWMPGGTQTHDRADGIDDERYTWLAIDRMVDRYATSHVVFKAGEAQMPTPVAHWL